MADLLGFGSYEGFLQNRHLSGLFPAGPNIVKVTLNVHPSQLDPQKTVRLLGRLCWNGICCTSTIVKYFNCTTAAVINYPSIRETLNSKTSLEKERSGNSSY